MPEKRRGIFASIFGGGRAARENGAICRIDYMHDPQRPPARFVTFDFETTDRNSTVAEIIEIGAVKYSSGVAVDSFETLVRPEGEISFFANRVHGITADMLSAAPSIRRVMPAFLKFIDGYPLVTYNGFTFDYKILQRVCASLGLSLQAIGYDAYQQAKAVLTRPQSHKLEYLRIYYGLDGEAHRALDDAMVTAEIWKMCWPSTYPKSARRVRWADSRPAPPVRPKDARQIYRGQPLPYKPEIYPKKVVTGINSPFHGKICVVTGELHITRPEAESFIRQAGGIVKTSVSQSTDFLIVGKQDINLVGDDGMSTKEERAAALNASGKGHIRRISERQFCAMLAADRAQIMQ